jgi:hypothetical protein
MNKEMCIKVGKWNNTKIVNRSFENDPKFKYLGKALTNGSCMRWEIKSLLNSGNASYQSFVLSLLRKHVKIKVHKYNTVVQVGLST